MTNIKYNSFLRCMTKTEEIDLMRSVGYPYRIKGNDGYNATLYGVQPLIGGEWAAIYMYPGGQYVHSLHEIENCFEVIEH